MTHTKWLARLDVNWRAVRFLAIGYGALSAFNLVFGLPIGYVSIKLLWLLLFLSGPAGILLGLLTTPGSWAIETVSWYVGGTCLLAPLIVLSFHRKALVSTPSIIVAALLWLCTGFFAVCYVLAFAA